MKIISWNVNGIRAAWAHGLSKFITESQADIYAFQETKLQEPLSYLEPDGYYSFWSFCRRSRGYSGTLCLSRWKPMAVSRDFSLPVSEEEKTFTFHLVRKETQGLEIPDVLVNQRIPTEAKYELENYFSYIIKKYGL